MPERTWIVRPYREGDEEGILDLFKVVYPNREYEYDKWMRWWHWLYQQNPAGRSYIWLAENKGKIVGHTATIPIMVKFGDKVLRSRLGTNAMTHPEYRGQGVYPTLRTNREKETTNGGIRTRYGFSGRGAAHRINRKYFNSLDVCTTNILVKPFKWRNSLRLLSENGVLLAIGAATGSTIQKIVFQAKETPTIKGLTISEISLFDERIDILYDEASRQHQIMVVRNKDYLNWRYVSIPDIDYSIYIAENESRLYGYIVTRSITRRKTVLGVIYDTLAVSPEILQILVAHVVEQLRAQGVDLVYGSMLANQRLLKAFSKVGFIRVPFWGNGFNVGSRDHHISKEFISNPDNWYAQIGDSDIL